MKGPHGHTGICAYDIIMSYHINSGVTQKRSDGNRRSFETKRTEKSVEMAFRNGIVEQ